MRAALDPDVGGALAAVLAHPLLYPLAALSYTGYLVSMITPAWAYLAVKHAGCGRRLPVLWVFYALNLAMTLSLGFVLSVLVERPLMRWGQALSRKRSADPPLARAVARGRRLRAFVWRDGRANRLRRAKSEPSNRRSAPPTIERRSLWASRRCSVWLCRFQSALVARRAEACVWHDFWTRGANTPGRCLRC